MKKIQFVMFFMFWSGWSWTQFSATNLCDMINRVKFKYQIPNKNIKHFLMCSQDVTWLGLILYALSI